MLYKRLKKALESVGKKVQDPNFIDGKSMGEEVVIGHNYTEDNSDYDGERPDLGESIPVKDPVSPNSLDPDYDIEEDTFSELDVELPTEFVTTVSATPEFYTATVSRELGSVAYDPNISSVTIDQKKESMDQMDKLKKLGQIEDTSGKTESNVTVFLEKYSEGNDVIQVLRTDLMKILSDVQWIKESKNQHEQWAIDFADALNELSVEI